MGDYLENQGNALAISMQFRKYGIPISNQEIEQDVLKNNGKLLILLHGLCMNDLQWNRKEHNHGEALSQELNYSSLYLFYNSGLHISQNGQKFSKLVETLIQEIPAIKEISFLCHSMGGLVARSACYYAEKQNHSWLKMLKKMAFLGTPHQGAPLEKGGNWLESLLELHSYTVPFSSLGKIRSAGITDLRIGNLVDEDWNEIDSFELGKQIKNPVSLPENVESFALGATISLDENSKSADLIGDGLVPVNSALGIHKNDDWVVSFPKKNQKLLRGINHLDLLSNSSVYEVIKKWFEGVI